MLAQWDDLHYISKFLPGSEVRHERRRATAVGEPRVAEALIEACSWGRLDLAKDLLRHGADPSASDYLLVDWQAIFGGEDNGPMSDPEKSIRAYRTFSRVKMTPMMAAALWGREDVLDYLANVADVNQLLDADGHAFARVPGSTENLGRAMSFAAVGGWRGCIEKLLALGAFPWNIEGDGGIVEPLEAAVIFGSVDNCSRLAEEITALDNGSRCGLGGGLALAASRGRLDLMEAIAKHGKGSWAEASPFLAMMAVDGGAEAVLAAESLAPGLARASRDEVGNTPLMRATFMRATAKSSDVARALLPFSDPLATNAMGATALLTALSHSHHGAVEALWDVSDKGARLSKGGEGLLAVACMAPDPDTSWILRIIQEDPVQLNRKSKDGYSPLASAVLHGNEAAALALLSSGADAAARGPGGDTVLHMAVERGASQAMLAALLSVCDANLQNDDGMTPLMRLLRSDCCDGFELVAHKSAMSVKNNKGMTAFDMAEDLEFEWGEASHGCFTNLLRALSESEALAGMDFQDKPASRRKSASL